jgi:SynChlorMet cassette radical SAM/SPASM protein ScmE
MADRTDLPPRRLMRSPREVDIDITTRCNLRCSYCYHFGSPGDVREDLPASEWLTFFEELGLLAVMEVSLAGGEPFIRKDIMDIIHGIVDNRMRFSILSNGTLITDALAEEIAATRHCNTVQVSIDGSRPEIHDSCRGTGSFKKAIAGIKCLQDHDVSVSIRVTIHHKNVHDLENIALFLLDELELPSFSTNAAGYFGLCQHHSADVNLTIEDRMIAMETLQDMEQRYPGRISANAGPLAEAKMFREMEEALKQNRPSIEGRGYLTGCNCTWQKIAVRADGIIIPCAMLPHRAIGRINQDSLRDIWQHHPLLLGMRARSSIPLSSFTYCSGCSYLPYCTGNCPAGAYAILGEDCHPSPEGCYRQFLSQGGSMRHMEHSAGTDP